MRWNECGGVRQLVPRNRGKEGQRIATCDESDARVCEMHGMENRDLRTVILSQITRKGRQTGPNIILRTKTHVILNFKLQGKKKFV